MHKRVFFSFPPSAPSVHRRRVSYLAPINPSHIRYRNGFRRSRRPTFPKQAFPHRHSSGVLPRCDRVTDDGIRTDPIAFAPPSPVLSCRYSPNPRLFGVQVFFVTPSSYVITLRLAYTRCLVLAISTGHSDYYFALAPII